MSLLSGRLTVLVSDDAALGTRGEGRVDQGRQVELEDPEPSASTRSSLVLGVVYQSSPDPYDGLLDRHLLFGDLYLGYIRAARVGFRGRLNESQHLFHLEGVTSMDIGPDGYIYGTKMLKDALFRIVPAS